MTAQPTQIATRESSVPTRPTRTFELIGQQALVVESAEGGDLLKIVAPDGRVRLAIAITPDGPVLELGGMGVMIRSSGPLAIDAERIALHGRNGLQISTGGDAAIRAEGDLTSVARIQNISASLGNVNVKANDDVRLNGERVMMNCDGEPPPSFPR